jgi:hypothetical protein
MRVSVSGQKRVRISEIVVAKRRSPSGNWRATFLAERVCMRWMVLGISKE